ncbi:MAG: TonB-dependent receptor, partial [Bacteroidales bacterium]|nr:TonB-dependent receptor [Bacteroidales bacterium]
NLLLLSQFAFSQGIKVIGVVKSAEDATSLPGVSIYVDGMSSIGTSTDLDGKYEITVPSSAEKLVFQSVGFETQVVTINSRTIINIVLKTEALDIEQVVVTGYTVQRKEALTSSVSTVDTKNIKAVSVSNVEKRLQGNIAGVMTTSLRGIPGSAPTIRVRGATSINAGNKPLFVIDGVPVVSGTVGESQSFSALSSLNPDDIKSITVLKDAGATAIYGARAANGVVLIQTITGEKGKTQFSLNVERGVSSVINNGFKMMNSSELLEIEREAVENSATYYKNPEKYDWTNPAGDYYLPDELADTDTDWWDEITRVGKLETYNLSASGGGERTTFYISGSYNNNEGAIINYDFERFTGNVNVNHSSKNDIFKAGSKISGSYSTQNYVNDQVSGILPYENPVFAAMSIPSYYAAFNKDGSVNFDLNGAHGNYNPHGVGKYQDKQQNYTKLLNSTYLELKPLPYLSFKSTFGLDYGYIKNSAWKDPRAIIYRKGEGAYWEQYETDVQLTTTNLINFNKVLFDKHSTSVILGQEATKQDYSYISGSGKGATHEMPYLSTTVAEGQEVSGNPSKLTRSSYFGLLTYNYDSRYYFQGSLRRDGASVFGDDYKHGNFGSVSGSWRISEESFFDFDFIDKLKLRASYGSTGNSDVKWYASKGYYAVVTYNGMSSTIPDRVSNPELRWEKTTTTDIALDFGLFKNRIRGTVEYFWAKTTDNLLKKELSLTSGFDEVLVNLGSLMNRGLEISLESVNIKGKDFNWNTSLNISFPRSEIKDLGGEDYVGTMYRHRVGGKYLEYWMFDYAGVNPANGLPMWYDADGNLTFTYSKARRINAGSPEPDFFGGITNTLSYKGITLDFMFYFVVGNEIIFGDRFYSEHDGAAWGHNINANGLNRWQKPGDITDVPKPLVNNPTGANDWDNSRWIDDGSYLRLKYITLSYDLPKKILTPIKLSNVSVFVKGTNLLTFSDVNGLDPERGSSGAGTYKYPNTKSISFGIQLGF